MAKPISFTKRDLEKKKQEKRLAKQQKKEENTDGRIAVLIDKAKNILKKIK